MAINATDYHSKHLGVVTVFTQYVAAHKEWTAYATNKGQYFWTTNESFQNAHDAELATVEQIELVYETELTKGVPA